MFASDIERKIIDIITKSPLGLTSSEIAKYLGVNRVTLTKYLAVIRQKALIDFKPLGMAKLWYVPIHLNKETFLSKIVWDILVDLPENEFKILSERVGIRLGEEINRMYLDFYGTEKLTFDQIAEAYADIGKKLGGNFKVRVDSEKISVEILQSPFTGWDVKIYKILSVVFAKLASLNLGYGRAMVLEPKEKENTFFNIYLKKNEEAQIK